ncbi:TPA: phosphoribosylaminoimidazolesuccinocarboxamide synthase, partial [Listeria innocua]|nr:phosphoribosylaminoimidazolesuccinocarboxamide synthase [Listeria innocua]
MTNELLYEGKAKRLFKTDEAGVLRVAYKDDATALNGVRKESFTGKGELNNQITSLIFSYLAKEGISSHFIRAISETEQLVKEVSIIPLEVVVRNVMAGSLAKRLGKEEGEEFPNAIVEFYYKDDALDDPFINDDHALYLDIATTNEMDAIRQAARSINKVLQELF